MRDGGLGMIDIFKYIKALKMTWIRKFEMKDTKRKPILFAGFPQLRNLSQFGNDFHQICSKNIKNCILETLHYYISRIVLIN